MLPAVIGEFLSATFCKGRKLDGITPVSGGSINSCYRLETGPDVYFLKVNAANTYPGLFDRERIGLEMLGSQNIIRVPAVILCESVKEFQLLVLEWVESDRPRGSFWRVFGEQLAQIHMVTASQFGFQADNYMGSLHQANPATDTWTAFFIESRLKPQLELAKKNNILPGHLLRSFEKLIQHMGQFFNEEPPALLHGDLWSGNFMCDDRLNPVLVDPAVYFGHRSVDLGMTTLFGGFHEDFYEAYNHHYPLLANAHEQWEIANLYPLLIHLNLFGHSYLGNIEATLKKYITL